MDAVQEWSYAETHEAATLGSPAGIVSTERGASRSAASPSPQGDFSAENSFAGLVGRSPGMRRLFDQLNLVSRRLRIAAIEGEDGTGKTSIARVLHRLSPFASKPFLSCLASSFLQPNAANPACEFWDSEVVKQADGGVLFLDRSHELDERQQERLFRFLLWFEHQQFVISPCAPQALIVTSDQSLRRLVAADTFRGDLCSRLTAIRLTVPPLRERREDIPLLAQFFVNRFSQTYSKTVRGLGPGTIAPLLRHPWPGNVRELESVIIAASLSTECGWIRPIDLPVLSPARTIPTQPVPSTIEDFSLDAAVHRHISRVLQQTRGNKQKAAALLGISRSTLYRMLASAPGSSAAILVSR